MEAAPIAHKPGLHSASHPSHSKRHSAQLAPAHHIAPIPENISAVGHGERHPSKILHYTHSKNAILIEARRVTHLEIQTLLSAVEKKKWNDGIFLAPNAYSILLQAYLDEKIDPEQFMNIQQWLEVYSQFGVRQDLPPAARLSAEVMRIDINDPRYQCQRETLIATMHERELKKGLAELFCKTLDYMQNNGIPAWVDRVVLTDPTEQERLDKAHSHLEDPPLRRISPCKQQILNWIRGIKRSSTPVITQVDMQGKKYHFFPARSINHSMQQLSNSAPVDLYPFYGTEKADQLREQREQNIHPRASFHPLAEDNLSSPHGLYIGTLEGFHDEYHGHLLSRIPEDMRALMIDMDRKEQALQQLIDGITLKPCESVLDHLPPDFITMLRKRASPQGMGSPGIDRLFNDVHTVLKIFKENRPFLDQECSNFPISADDANDIHLANYIIYCIMETPIASTPQPEKHIQDLEFRFINTLKWHWLLYQYRNNSPEKLLRLRDTFATATREIRKLPGNPYNPYTCRLSKKISYHGLVCLLGDIANRYTARVD